MKRLLAVLLLLLVPTNALATTYHVRVGGTNGATGLSWGNAWATLDKANTEARPGDVIYCWQGFQDFVGQTINPDSAGSRDNATPYITFIGNSAHGDAITDSTYRPKIGALALSGVQRVTVKGFWSNSTISLSALCKYDSLVNNTANNGLSIINSSDNVVANNSFLSGEYNMNSNGTSMAARDTIEGNRFYNLQGVFNGVIRFGQNTGATATIVDSNLIKDNFLDCYPSSSAEMTVMSLFNSSHNKFVGNRIQGTWTNPNYSIGVKIRDRSISNSHVRDTFIITGPEYTRFFFSTNGTGGWDTLGASGRSRWDSCLIVLPNGGIIQGNGWNRDTLRWTTLVASGKALRAIGSAHKDTTIMDHLTIVGTDYGGVFDFFDYSWATGSYLKLTNSIIAGWTSGSDLANVVPITKIPCHDGAHWAEPSATKMHFGGDSANVHLFLDHNLYYSPTQRSTAGDRTHKWCASNDCYECLSPTTLNTRYVAMDDSSIVGNPLFLNGVRNELFDGTLKSSSPARGIGINGVDAGAVAYITANPIADLGVFGQVSFIEIAVGDTDSVTVQIQNLAAATADSLKITAITTLETWSTVLSSDFTAPYIAAAPLGTVNLKVYFVPTSTTPEAAWIKLATNDPIRPTIFLYIGLNCDLDLQSGCSGTGGGEAGEGLTLPDF